MLVNEINGNTTNGEPDRAQTVGPSYSNGNDDVYNYNQYLFIRIKNNDANLNDYLRVLHFVMQCSHSVEVAQYWTEKGKTGKKHMHFIVKQRIPFFQSEEKVNDFFKEVQRKFKCKRTLKYVTIEPVKAEGSVSFIPVEWSINLKRYSIYLSRFENKQHYDYVTKDYCKKEH